jgi:hypothetical protein
MRGARIMIDLRIGVQLELFPWTKPSEPKPEPVVEPPKIEFPPAMKETI